MYTESSCSYAPRSVAAKLGMERRLRMNPQSSFHPPAGSGFITIIRGITVVKCVYMHICTKLHKAISEKIQLTSHPFTWDTQMRLSISMGLNDPPDYTRFAPIHLIKHRVVPLSPSRGRPLGHGGPSGDNQHRRKTTCH
jgi:hypothetical protein